jgi:hypothetical protein
MHPALAAEPAADLDGGRDRDDHGDQQDGGGRPEQQRWILGLERGRHRCTHPLSRIVHPERGREG